MGYSPATLELLNLLHGRGSTETWRSGGVLVEAGLTAKRVYILITPALIENLRSPAVEPEDQVERLVEAVALLGGRLTGRIQKARGVRLLGICAGESAMQSRERVSLHATPE